MTAATTILRYANGEINLTGWSWVIMFWFYLAIPARGSKS